jgi:hypothetical protein
VPGFLIDAALVVADGVNHSGEDGGLVLQLAQDAHDVQGLVDGLDTSLIGKRLIEVVVRYVAQATEVAELASSFHDVWVPTVAEAVQKIAVGTVGVRNSKASPEQEAATDVEGGIIGAAGRRPPLSLMGTDGPFAGKFEKLVGVHYASPT